MATIADDAFEHAKQIIAAGEAAAERFMADPSPENRAAMTAALCESVLAVAKAGATVAAEISGAPRVNGTAPTLAARSA